MPKKTAVKRGSSVKYKKVLKTITRDGHRFQQHFLVKKEAYKPKN
jgi:hypothetical protein